MIIVHETSSEGLTREVECSVNKNKQPRLSDEELRMNQICLILTYIALNKFIARLNFLK